jgi:hypothetical protein
MLYVKGKEIFQKSIKKTPKILGPRMVTRNKTQSEGPRILGTA